MAKEFKDFTYGGKKLSSINKNYISVSFEQNEDINLAMEREMEIGSTNRYRTEPNFFYDKWSGKLSFTLCIVKNPDLYNSQLEREITKEEIRQITRWLTSSHLPQWIKFEYENNDNDVTNYYGYFKNIETFTVSGIVYGFRMLFECTTQFGYTDEIVKREEVSTYKNVLLKNDSDELNDYCYPTLDISPKSNGQIYFCNLSDCKLLENGILTDSSNYFDDLLNKVDAYALSNGYKVEYSYLTETEESFNIVPLCNDTAVQFYLVDSYGIRTKCTAFFLNDTHEYRIIVGGFIFMDVYKGLDVHIDFKNLIIEDSIGRMITYDKLGIYDVDNMYWTRLINGNNTFLLYGNCTFEFKYRESRKVGE